MTSGRIAFLFPGQGSQAVGMGKDFADNFRESRLIYEEASDATGLNLERLCFDGPLDALTLTENLQPALFTTEAAILAAIRSQSDIQPTVSAGHSLGEYAALYAAGALSLADGARLTRIRGQAMQQAVPVGQGGMLAILGLGEDLVRQLCQEAVAATKEILTPANFNAPGQIVIAGTTLALNEASRVLKTDSRFDGGRAMPLPVSAPFHCPLMKPAQERLQRVLSEISFGPMKFPVIANRLAHPVTHSEQLPGLLASQVVAPVLWEQSMRKLTEMNVEAAFEIGPGRVLSGMLKRTAPQINTTNVSTVAQFREVFS